MSGASRSESRGGFRGLLRRVAVAVAREVLSGEEGVSSAATPIHTPTPSPDASFRDALPPSPPSPSSTFPFTPTSTPYPFPLAQEEEEEEVDGEEEEEADDLDEEVEEEVEEEEAPPTNAPRFDAARNESLARRIRELLDRPNPNAPPLPARPKQKDDEDDDAYDQRLDRWSQRIAAAAPHHSTLRDLADRPVDKDLMVNRIRAHVNPALVHLIRGLDTQAALPIFTTETEKADADVALRVFPLFGTMGHIAAKAGDVASRAHSVMTALDPLGWHPYGIEYSGQVQYIVFIPASVGAASLPTAKGQAAGAGVTLTSVSKWALLNGVPILSVYNRHPL